MRRPRVNIDSTQDEAVYHCISRTVGNQFLFGDEEKEMMRRQLWVLAEYCGLQIITYVLMSNHYHILVRVPRRTDVSDRELLRRYRLLHTKLTAQQAKALATAERQMKDRDPAAEAWRSRQKRQMFNLSKFQKLFKMRFSIWYNHRHDRKGTLWSERFKSLLVEDGQGVETSAAYIDLNSVRAGMVEDPKDYRYCGYAQAVAGRSEARRGLSEIYGRSWGETSQRYRCLLFGSASDPMEMKGRISEERFKEVVKQDGRLSVTEVLRCRIRYFTDGVVLGTPGFVSRQIGILYRHKPEESRPKPQKLLPVTNWTGLCVLSRMRGTLIS